MPDFDNQQHLSCSARTDTLTHWVENKISRMEEDIQRDLSDFGESSLDLPCDDDGSIASEVEKLSSFQESIRTEIQKLDVLSRWKGLSEAKRIVMERQLSDKNDLQALPCLESATYDDTSDESISETLEELGLSPPRNVPREISSLETALSTLLAQYRGIGKASLALACDFLVSPVMDMSPVPVLLPWVRHQLDLSHPPSILEGEWLFRVPLLGNVARGENGEMLGSCASKDDEARQGEIQEIEEDCFDDYSS